LPETLPTFEATANKAQLGVSQPAVSRRVQQSTTCRPSLLSSQTTTRSELPFSAFEEGERDISPDDSHPGHNEEEDRYEVNYTDVLSISKHASSFARALTHDDGVLFC
jgi:hypothetical protein